MRVRGGMVPFPRGSNEGIAIVIRFYPFCGGLVGCFTTRASRRVDGLVRKFEFLYATNSCFFMLYKNRIYKYYFINLSKVIFFFIVCP